MSGKQRFDPEFSGSVSQPASQTSAQLLEKLLMTEYQSVSSEKPSDTPLPQFSGTADFAKYFCSLLQSVKSGDVPAEVAAQRTKCHLETYPSLAPIVAEQLQIEEYTTEGEGTESTGRYVQFVSQLTIQNVLPAAELRERLEQEALQSVGLSDKGLNWETRYVRTKTKWFFKLQKFNLLREEPEGFTELIDVLEQASFSTSAAVTDKIMEIAGKYDLDVYRVVEIVVTAACSMPVPLTRVLLDFCDSVDFDTSTLVALIGTRFKAYAQKNSKEVRRIRGLCQVACFVVADGITTWDELIPHIPYDNADSELHWNKMLDRARAENSIINTKSLSVKEKQNVSEIGNFEDLIAFFEESRNPRVELIAVMLQQGMYHDAIRLISGMPIHYATTFHRVAFEVAKVVHYIIDPVYRSMKPSLVRPSSKTDMPSVMNEQLPPQVHSLDEIDDKLEPWLNLLGSNVVFERRLLGKLLHMMYHFVHAHKDGITDGVQLEGNNRRVFSVLLHMMEHVFLPALTRGMASSPVSEMIFSILRMIPYHIRFTLYYKLKTDFYPNGHPIGMLAKSITIANSKWFQKRVNKDNFKFCGRIVGKDLSNNATIVSTYLTDRIVSYDNFGMLVTDAMKNSSAFAADIMLYTVLEHMSMPSFRKHDLMSILPSYRFIAAFCAAFAKKQPVDVEPIVDYVVGMLKSGSTVDLLVLKELVHKLSGIELSEGVTDEQLEALAGGDVLKSEGAYFSPMRNTKRSSIRLKEALLKSKQALPLCLMISHVESNTLYRETDGKNLKLLGTFYDMCHDTLVQYGTFLSNNLSKKEYADNFPTLAELIRTYQMPFETSIFLLRSVYWDEIMTKVDTFKKEREIPSGPLNDTDLVLVQERFSSIFDDVIGRVVELIAPVMTQAPMEDISLRFYVLFWFLSLYDLYVPTGVYSQEMLKLQQVLEPQPIDTEEDRNQDREIILAVIKRKKEKDRATTVIQRLKEEMSVQSQHVRMLKNHLAEEKDKWFLMAKTTKSDVVSQFLQMCVLPRSTFSTIDALFSAHFVTCLHDLRTANFSTLLCYDRMLCDITTALTCCSENEASRYGRLLHSVLETIMRWHKSQATFDAECHHHPGFVTKFRTPSANTGSDTVDHIDYENFRHVCHKWHFKLTKSMVSCLESGVYVRIRNGLIVLDRILPFYPVISNFYLAVDKRVKQVMELEKDKRPDLHTLALGYMGRLRGQKNNLILEKDFHEKDKGKKDGKTAEIKPEENGELADSTSAVSGYVKTESPLLFEAEKKTVVVKSEANSKKSDSGSPKLSSASAKSPLVSSAAKPKPRPTETDAAEEIALKSRKPSVSTKEANGLTETKPSISTSVVDGKPPSRKSKPQNGVSSDKPPQPLPSPGSEVFDGAEAHLKSAKERDRPKSSKPQAESGVKLSGDKRKSPKDPSKKHKVPEGEKVKKSRKPHLSLLPELPDTLKTDSQLEKERKEKEKLASATPKNGVAAEMEFSYPAPVSRPSKPSSSNDVKDKHRSGSSSRSPEAKLKERTKSTGEGPSKPVSKKEPSSPEVPASRSGAKEKSGGSVSGAKPHRSNHSSRETSREKDISRSSLVDTKGHLEKPSKRKRDDSGEQSRRKSLTH